MLTVRLDSELEAKVGIVAKNMHVSKSELVRRSLVEFVKNTPKLSPWHWEKSCLVSMKVKIQIYLKIEKYS